MIRIIDQFAAGRATAVAGTRIRHEHAFVVPRVLAARCVGGAGPPFACTRRIPLAATVDLQQALEDPAATSGVPLRVRCGLHKGVVERRDDDYFGSPVNRAARIMSAAHGGQVLLSRAVVDDVADKLPAGVSLRDLGAIQVSDHLSHGPHTGEVGRISR